MRKWVALALLLAIFTCVLIPVDDLKQDEWKVRAEVWYVLD